MYLYLRNTPRTLYLATSSHEERLGRPRRALAFSAGEVPAQAVVKFLPQDEIDFHNLVKVTNRIVKGCLGIISLETGMS